MSNFGGYATLTGRDLDPAGCDHTRRTAADSHVCLDCRAVVLWVCPTVTRAKHSYDLEDGYCHTHRQHCSMTEPEPANLATEVDAYTTDRAIATTHVCAGCGQHIKIKATGRLWSHTRKTATGRERCSGSWDYVR